MKAVAKHYIRSVLNSYAILFFSQNKVLGFLMLVATFCNPAAAATGLAFAIFAIAYAMRAHFPIAEIQKGVYSFNALLLGISLGTFYHLTPVFCLWAAAACFLCVLITVSLSVWLGKKNLPFLSLPFIISFWIIFSAANSVFQLGLAQRSSIILNELSTTGTLHSFLSIPVHLGYYPGLFFKSLGAILFQDNVLAGVIISIGLIIHSRIAFSVLVLGFAEALLLNHFTSTYPEGISYYHLGSNLMLPAMAIGSFFMIPSYRSYLWAVVSVPVVFLGINALTKLLGTFDLPVISLPFCLVCLLFLHVIIVQKSTLLPLLQFYSPEINLYQYLNGSERLDDLRYVDIKPPFMGKWKISQGYNGNITHKKEWGSALDFIIEGDDHKTYKSNGCVPEHFYCYGKPVLACASGVVEEVVDYVDDNQVGEVNLRENWGNTVVIKHVEGLYSKVSHLKKGSVKVKVGEFVRQGDVIALCGNSGRSPEPHLHFQMQITPYIGSQSVAYPFAIYVRHDTEGEFIDTHQVPAEGTTISLLMVNSALKKAFNLQPGYTATVTSDDTTEVLEVHTNELNQLYLYSRKADSYAYFINNGTSHYFTGFYGDQKSLLYFFYLAAYKVVFSNNVTVKDSFPLQLASRPVARWVQDFVAPFYQYIRLNYQSTNCIKGETVIVHSSQTRQVFNKVEVTMSGGIQITDHAIQGFSMIVNGVKTEAKWTVGNI